MTATAQIQATRADFLDPSLYDDSSLAALSHSSRGTLLTGLSHAFDLAEGRRPGHAQRVAYIGITLASELNLAPSEVEDVFFACLLHDIGMSGVGAGLRVENGHGIRMISGTSLADDVLSSVVPGRWPATRKTAWCFRARKHARSTSSLLHAAHEAAARALPAKSATALARRSWFYWLT